MIINWTILKLSTIDTDNIKQYVTTVEYQVEAIDETYKTLITDSIDFEFSLNDNYVSYSELTEDIVISWIKLQLGSIFINKIEAYLSTKINELKNPKPEVQVSTLPWS